MISSEIYTPISHCTNHFIQHLHFQVVNSKGKAFAIKNRSLGTRVVWTFDTASSEDSTADFSVLSIQFLSLKR